MDEIDLMIVDLLERDGRASVTEVAKAVGLSTSACSRRLADLHERSIITGYRAVVDPKMVGRDVEVIAFVTMDQEDAATIADFEAQVATLPDVRHAERLFGDPDYLIRVATDSIETYQTIRDAQLATLPGVRRISSTIVMRRVVDDRPLGRSATSNR